MLWFQIYSWYHILVMLLLTVLSVKAYRRSLKKIFLLFLVITIPIILDVTYSKIDSFLLRHKRTTIALLIQGKKITDPTAPEPRYVEYEYKLQKMSTDFFNKENQLRKEYTDAIREKSRSTWLKTLWKRIVFSLSSVLFPIAAIFVCLTEIKHFKHEMFSARLSRDESMIKINHQKLDQKDEQNNF